MHDKPTVVEQLDLILTYMPGGLGEIAMMVPCHINTLKKIRAGNENVRPIIKNRLDQLFDKALQIKCISES